MSSGESKRKSQARQLALKQAKAKRLEQERRDREREARKLARRKALRRRRFLAGVITTVMFAVATVLVIILDQPSPTTVSGSLSGVRGVSFVEGGSPNNSYSPVCGCYRPPTNSWRGVAFGAKAVTIARTGTAPWTEWALSGADPDKIALIGGTKFLRLVAFRLRPRGTFDASWLTEPDLRSHAEVLSKENLGFYADVLLTKRPIHVALLGPTPIAAWIPFPGSQVALGTQTSLYPQSPGLPQLVDTYPTTVGSDRKHDLQSYSLGDFLGPNLVLWTDDPAAHIPGSKLPGGTKPGVITALLLANSAFSLRVASVPFTERDRRNLERVYATHQNFRYSPPFLGTFDSGKVTLTLNHPLTDSEYSSIRAYTAAHPTLQMPVQENPWLALPNGAIEPAPPKNGDAPAPQDFTEGERYPPLPVFNGWSVWGPLQSVSFGSVSGSLNVAGADKSLAGAPTLSLTGVRGLHNSNDQELLEAPLQATSDAAQLDFSAVAAVNINGDNATTVSDNHRMLYTLIMAAITLLGTSFTIFTFLQGMKLSSERSD